MEGETMNAPTYDDSVTNSILEVFPICQKLVMNSVNLKEPRLTKTQLHILLSLIGKPRLTMSQLAAYIASSKEQATRAVAPLVAVSYTHLDVYKRQHLHRGHIFFQGNNLADQTLLAGIDHFRHLKAGVAFQIDDGAVDPVDCRCLSHGGSSRQR